MSSPIHEFLISGGRNSYFILLDAVPWSNPKEGLKRELDRFASCTLSSHPSFSIPERFREGLGDRPSEFRFLTLFSLPLDFQTSYLLGRQWWFEIMIEYRWIVDNKIWSNRGRMLLRSVRRFQLRCGLSMVKKEIVACHLGLERTGFKVRCQEVWFLSWVFEAVPRPKGFWLWQGWEWESMTWGAGWESQRTLLSELGIPPSLPMNLVGGTSKEGYVEFTFFHTLVGCGSLNSKRSLLLTWNHTFSFYSKSSLLRNWVKQCLGCSTVDGTHYAVRLCPARKGFFSFLDQCNSNSLTLYLWISFASGFGHLETLLKPKIRMPWKKESSVRKVWVPSFYLINEESLS